MVDQEGGRVARLRPPHWRAHPPAAASAARGRARGLADRRADRPRLRRGGLRRGCRTGAGPRHPWRARGDRRPGARRGARVGGAAGPRDGGRPARRRCPAGRQACAGPWPRPGRQPSRAAARRGEPPRCRSAAVRLERRPALGHVGAHRLSRLGRRAAGDVVPDRDRGDHPRPDRLRRSSGDRRPRHEGAGRRARRSGAAGAGGRLRRRAVLQRRARRPPPTCWRAARR